VYVKIKSGEFIIIYSNVNYFKFQILVWKPYEYYHNSNSKVLLNNFVHPNFQNVLNINRIV